MRKPLVKFAGEKPKCFTSHTQYRQWVKLARGTVTNKAYGPCIDCTPNFQRSMIHARKCENPLVEFRLVDVTIRKGETIKELQGYVRVIKEDIDQDGRC
jgi:hypothetical protein